MGLEKRYVKLKKKQKAAMTGQKFKKNEIMYIQRHDDSGLLLIDPRNPLRRLSIKLDFDIIEVM